MGFTTPVPQEWAYRPALERKTRRSGAWHRVSNIFACCIGPCHELSSQKAQPFCYITSRCVTFLIHRNSKLKRNLNYVPILLYKDIHIDGCIYTHITSRSSSNETFCHAVRFLSLSCDIIVQPYRHGRGCFKCTHAFFLRRTERSSSHHCCVSFMNHDEGEARGRASMAEK